MKDTPENRMLYCHFRAQCFQCSGWGVVTERDKDCVHEFEELSLAQVAEEGLHHYGNCWHTTSATANGS